MPPRRRPRAHTTSSKAAPSLGPRPRRRRALTTLASIAVALLAGQACVTTEFVVVDPPERPDAGLVEQPPVVEDGSDGDDDAGDAGALDAPYSPPYPPPVACGTTLPGAPLSDGAVEGEPNYAARLAAVDLSATPETIDLSSRSSLVRGIVRYALEAPAGDVYSKSALLSQGGPMGRAVVAAVAMAGSSGTAIDVTFLRQGLHYFAPCTRPFPVDLDTLRARYGDYRSWQLLDIDCSPPKNGPRRLFHDEGAGVFVAETIVDGSVRETEVLFSKTRADGQLDFAAYTEDGHLTDRSTFATTTSSLTSAAPYTCMTCHLSAASGRFDVVFPAGRGAGCAGSP